MSEHSVIFTPPPLSEEERRAQGRRVRRILIAGSATIVVWLACILLERIGKVDSNIILWTFPTGIAGILLLARGFLIPVLNRREREQTVIAISTVGRLTMSSKAGFFLDKYYLPISDVVAVMCVSDKENRSRKWLFQGAGATHQEQITFNPRLFSIKEQEEILGEVISQGCNIRIIRRQENSPHEKGSFASQYWKELDELIKVTDSTDSEEIN
ncbi:MAG: hypothetical protein GY757_10690 [bacterium]|nr:hypothetical protein [bacterium]